MLFTVAFVVGGAFAQSTMTGRATTLPLSSQCDDTDLNGMSNVNGWMMGKTCMSSSRSDEDDWFVANVCPKYKFTCFDDESAADCAKANDAACETMRRQWLGNIGLLPRVEIDTSATRVKNSALDVVTVTDKPTWFDASVPRADFSNAVPTDSDSCSYRPSDWQDESEHMALLSNPPKLGTGCGVTLPSDFASYPQDLKGVLYYLLDNVYEEFNPQGSEYAGTKPPTLRKDIRTLSEADRVRYLTALAKTECLGLTKIWGSIHASSPADMHSGPGFLPSHSIFMRIYELALQRFGDLGEDIGLHIVGWPADSTLPRWHQGRIRYSAIWGDEYIGPIADQWIGSEKLTRTSSIFSKRVPWDTPSPQAEEKKLARHFRNVEQRGGYISPQDVWGVMDIDDPLEFGCKVERSILHGGQHMVISGHMGNLLAASWDAAFFMHHGFVDCLYRSWQMQGATQADRGVSAKMPDMGPRWRKHKPTDFAHWTKWVSPKDGKTKQITHAQAYQYRKSGRGSYRCIIPSLLPCKSDEDCGVPAGTAREDKRLYCTVAQVCSQYIETNAICRNEYGSFLPCQKQNDRCQYSPKMYAKENGGKTAGPADTTFDAWYCVSSPALACGDNADKSSCSSAAGCKWVDSAAGVQNCPTQVPSFGFGVFETSSETLQPVGAKFDFKAAPFSSANAQSWTLTDKGVSATIKPKSFVRGKTADNSKLSLYKSTAGFGIDESGVTSGVACTAAAQATKGDTPSNVDRNEVIEITFDQEVILQSMNLGAWGAVDKIEIELYNGATLVAIQQFDTPTVVFGVSSGDAAQDCPKNICKVTKINIMHESAGTPTLSAAIGKMSGTKCVASFPGSGFSLDSLTVGAVSAAGGSTGTGGSNAQASSFTGYCTGAPDSTGDYTYCANQDVCYISPPDTDAGHTTEVDVILVPAGTCGPKGWIPQITFTEQADPKSKGGKALKAQYVSQCSCGAAGEKLTGKGPMSGDPTKFRPLFDLYRVQDRLKGNDDARREEYWDAMDNMSSSSSLKVVLSLLAAFVAMFAALL